MSGEPRDFTDVALDLGDIPEFNRKVYDIARTIPAGQTLTYGEIATRLGDKLLSRDVGTALGQNPFPIIVPCHRVLAASGKTGGFSAPGGVNTKSSCFRSSARSPADPTYSTTCRSPNAPPLGARSVFRRAFGAETRIHASLTTIRPIWRVKRPKLAQFRCDFGVRRCRDSQHFRATYFFRCARAA